MTRGQAIGVLAISLLASAVAATSLVSGVITLLDRGPFAAMPALVIVPLILGGVAFFALRTGMAWWVRSGRVNAEAASREAFVQRALSHRSSGRRRRR